MTGRAARFWVVLTIGFAAAVSACSNSNSPSPTTTTTVAATTTTVAATTTVATSTVPASAATYSLTGQLTEDETNRGISGAEIEILSGASNVGAKTTTNAVGLYQFTNMASGTYRLRVRATGYNLVDQTATIANADTRFDILLHKPPATTTTTVPALSANFTYQPSPCTLTGASATVNCVVDAAPSTGAIVSYSWLYAGITVTNSSRFQLALTCGNTGTNQQDSVSVTLTVADGTGLTSSITIPVVVVKSGGACGFP